MKTIREKFEELEESKLENTLKDYEFLVHSKLEENPDVSYEDIRPVEFKFYREYTFEYLAATFVVKTYYAYDPFLDMYVGKFVAEGDSLQDVFKILNSKMEYDYSDVKYIYSTSIEALLGRLDSVRKYMRSGISVLLYQRTRNMEKERYYIKSQNIVKK